MSKIGISIKVRVFREVEVDGCLFRCYDGGRVERRLLDSNQHGKKGDWIRCDNNRPDSNGYVQVIINGKNYKLHRIVYLAYNPTWAISNPKKQIDHINGDKVDNRIENLRQATRSQNGHNSRVHSDNKLGLKNICERGDCWVVQICKDRKMVVQKYFHKCDYTLDDVIAFRNDELLTHHGDFARL
jgi:hypothetical protein